MYELDVEVKIKDETGSTWSMSKYAKEMQQEVSTFRFDLCVYLAGWIAHMCFRCLQWRTRLRSEVFATAEPLVVDAYDESDKHEITEATIFTTKLLERSAESLSPRPWPVLLLVSKNRGTSSLGGLIFKSLEGDRFERLGVLSSEFYGPNVDLPVSTRTSKKASFVMSSAKEIWSASGALIS
ncbi:Nn.00g031430.m01.CDS01 [Neocucurbitaria sp. VM-36]